MRKDLPKRFVDNASEKALADFESGSEVIKEI